MLDTRDLIADKSLWAQGTMESMDDPSCQVLRWLHSQRHSPPKTLQGPIEKFQPQNGGVTLKSFIPLLCLLLFAVAFNASAQQYEDIVYLKDGSMIRGIIVEQVPNEYLKIRIQGGTVFIFKMADVSKIAKEVSTTPMSFQRKKHPGIAFALSFLVIGTGQAYNGQLEKALAHWLVAGGCIWLTYAGLEDNYWGDRDGDDHLAILGIAFGLGNWIWSMIDAPFSAIEINRQRSQNQGISLIEDHLLLEPYISQKTRGAMLSLRF